jgi:hypothetical protein
MSRGKCCVDCCELEVSSITTTGTELNIAVAPQTLNDGRFYRIRLDTAFPVGLTGTEAVVITMDGTTIPLGDKRARILRSERVRYKDRLCLVYTQDSLVGIGVTPPVAESAFIVLSL